MSKGRRRGSAVGPPGIEAEEFMAILLWSQRSECECLSCSYFRKMADRMMKKYVPAVEGENNG